MRIRLVYGIITLLLPCIFIPSFGSNYPKELKDDFSTAEYFFLTGHYTDALEYYQKVAAQGYAENPNINYCIGVCYNNIPGLEPKAISYLLEAEKMVSTEYKRSSLKETFAPPDTYFELGNLYRRMGKLDEAKAAYTKYRSLVTGGWVDLTYVNQQIRNCSAAKKMFLDTVSIESYPLAIPIQNVSSNFRSVVSGDGTTMALMCREKFYDAVYIATFDNGKWTRPVNITQDIRSDGDLYVCDISYDASAILFSKDEDGFDRNIYVSYKKDGRWTEAVPINAINTAAWETHACFNKEMNTIYFCSDRRDSYGGLDIYTTSLDGDGNWTEPKNLGGMVNSNLNENTVFISEDGSMLFYSSQGFKNMGGYDVFVSKKASNGTFSRGINLKYPINTPGEELFYYPWSNGKFAFYSKTDSTSGDFKIYRIVYHSNFSK